MISEVLEHHAHLFSPQERQRIDCLLGLDRDAKFARLLTRKGCLFRRSKIRYDEIADLDAAIEILREREFLDEPTERQEMVGLLTVPELRALARTCGVDSRGSKLSLVERLSRVEASSSLHDVDRFIRIVDTMPFELARIVFFGNRHQDVSEFVTTALSINSYATYHVSREAPLFATRKSLDDFIEASMREEAAYEQWVTGDLEKLIGLEGPVLRDLAGRPQLPAHAASVDPARSDERLLMMIARAHERAGDLERAIVTYSELLSRGRGVRRRAKAFDRLGLALRRTGRHEELRGFAAPLLESPSLDDVSRHLIELRLARCGLGPDPRGRLLRPTEQVIVLKGAGHRGTKALYEDRAGRAVAIEEAVLEAVGGEGYWCEGTLMTTLFGLLFWDVIFAPVQGMFQHRFQDAPLDFDHEGFYLNRRDSIEARLERLERGGARSLLDQNHAEHEGQRCRGVSWELGFDALDRAVSALEPALSGVMARLARAPGVHRAGMPDLFVFANDRAKLIEVKGPGDQVSVEQSLWHDALLRLGVDVEIARVTRA